MTPQISKQRPYVKLSPIKTSRAGNNNSHHQKSHKGDGPLSPLSAALDNDKSRKIYYSDTGENIFQEKLDEKGDAFEKGLPESMNDHEKHLLKQAQNHQGKASTPGGTSSDQQQVQFVRAMTPLGAFSIASETETNLSIASCSLQIEGELPHEEIIELLDTRLCRNHYRFRCSVKNNCFVEKEDFDVRRHVKYIKLRQSKDEDKELRRLISKFMNVPLPDGQPLWECLVFEGYSKGQFFLFRIHHSLGDGSSLASCFISVCDQSYEDLERSIMKTIQDSPSQKAKMEAARGKNPIDKLLKGLLFALWFSVGTIQVVAKWIREIIRGPDRETVFNRGGKVGTKKRVAYLSNSFNLEEVKELGHQYKATINDIILSCISGGMSRYYKKYVDREELGAKYYATNYDMMRISIPVNVRTKPLVKRLGNKFGFVVSRVPIGNGIDSEKRLKMVKKAMDSCKKTPEHYCAYYFGKLITHLPIPVLNSAFNRLGSMLTFVFSNVRGSPEQLSIRGHKITDLLGFVPCPSGTALGFALLSYVDKLSLTVAADEKTITNPEDLIACIEEEYQHLREMAANKQDEDYGTFEGKEKQKQSGSEKEKVQ